MVGSAAPAAATPDVDSGAARSGSWHWWMHGSVSGVGTGGEVDGEGDVEGALEEGDAMEKSTRRKGTYPNDHACFLSYAFGFLRFSFDFPMSQRA